MLNKIKKNVERHISAYLKNLDTLYGLKRISPLLFGTIKEFVRRPGKRVRPSLFVAGFLGYARRPVAGLYTSALSLELLHDFMLVHDDVIDKATLRRGKPAVHTLLNQYLRAWPRAKFSGEDLAIVAGDVMYALALHTFLEIKADKGRKEMAFKKLIEAALYTGSGEFIELTLGLRGLDNVRKQDIYRVYDLKTAYYTFACPLAMGAILGGARDADVRRLTDFGLAVGRAFQIKDDILGMFYSEEQTGKSALSDLQEAKKTLLIWQTYRTAPEAKRARMRRLLNKTAITPADLNTMRRMMQECAAVDFAKAEVRSLLRCACAALERTRLAPAYRQALSAYAREILAV